MVIPQNPEETSVLDARDVQTINDDVCDGVYTHDPVPTDVCSDVSYELPKHFTQCDEQNGEPVYEGCKGLPQTRNRTMAKAVKRKGFDPTNMEDEEEIYKDFVMVGYEKLSGNETTPGGYKGKMRLIPPATYVAYLTDICPVKKDVMLDFNPLEGNCLFCREPVKNLKQIYAGVLPLRRLTRQVSEAQSAAETTIIGPINRVCTRTQCVTQLWKRMSEIPSYGSTESRLEADYQCIADMQKQMSDLLNTLPSTFSGSPSGGTVVEEEGCPVDCGLRKIINSARKLPEYAQSGAFFGIETMQRLTNLEYACMEEQCAVIKEQYQCVLRERDELRNKSNREFDTDAFFDDDDNTRDRVAESSKEPTSQPTSSGPAECDGVHRVRDTLKNVQVPIDDKPNQEEGNKRKCEYGDGDDEDVHHNAKRANHASEGASDIHEVDASTKWIESTPSVCPVVATPKD